MGKGVVVVVPPFFNGILHLRESAEIGSPGQILLHCAHYSLRVGVALGIGEAGEDLGNAKCLRVSPECLGCWLAPVVTNQGGCHGVAFQFFYSIWELHVDGHVKGCFPVLRPACLRRKRGNKLLAPPVNDVVDAGPSVPQCLYFCHVNPPEHVRHVRDGLDCLRLPSGAKPQVFWNAQAIVLHEPENGLVVARNMQHPVHVCCNLPVSPGGMPALDFLHFGK